METQSPLVRGHDSAHRRGLVMGLTMAEIMLMILFILLLVMGVLVENRDRVIHHQQKRLADLQALDHYVADVLKDTGGRMTVTDIIQRIERDNQKVLDLQREVAALRSQAASGRAIEDIIKEIKREGGDPTPSEIAAKLQATDKLTHENTTLAGQVTQLTNQIKAAGRGNEFPSCWVTPDGKVQSIFELVLSPSGIVVKDHTPPDRLTDKAALPLSGVRYDTPLAVDEFISQMRPLYSWSIAKGCRFYVIRYSVMPSAPIPDVNAISDFFYPDSRIVFDKGRL